jgi:preprotein translocase subunit SecA
LDCRHSGILPIKTTEHPMLTQILNLIFGSKNDREIKALMPIVHRINTLEPELTPLSDHALADKTQAFKKRLAAGETLEEIIPKP